MIIEYLDYIQDSKVTPAKVGSGVAIAAGGYFGYKAGKYIDSKIRKRLAIRACKDVPEDQQEECIKMRLKRLK